MAVDKSMVDGSRFVITEANFVLSAPSVDQIPALGMSEVAFFGRSNVGKSSLINALAGKKKLAKVSNTPGCTALINVFSAKIIKSTNIDKYSKEFCFVDLPGVGYAKVSKTELIRYSKIVSNYVTQSSALTSIFHLFDIRRKFNDEDLAIKRELQNCASNYFLVLTKADKLAKNKRVPALKKFTKTLEVSEEQLLLSSTIKNISLDKIFSALWQSL